MGARVGAIGGRSRAGPGRHVVVVEVILLRAAPGGGLAYRSDSSTLPAGEDPDRTAARLAGPLRPDGLLHSTSWRRADDGRLLLTYVAVPDPCPDRPATPLTDLTLARGTDPVQPSPVRIEACQVAAHAVRHLALLRRTDPVVAGALARHGGLDRDVSAAEPTPAGRLP